MGTFVGTISQRDSLGNSPARMAEFANKLTEAMLGCGMLKVPDVDFSGQAGKFVTGQAMAGETQIVALGSTIGANVIGYNLFKHPTLNLYVQIHYLDVVFSVNTARSAYFRVTFATGLVAGVLDNPVVVSPWQPYNNSTVSIANLPTTYTTFFASCAADHFWLGGKPIHALTASTSYDTAPNGVSPLCLGIFASDIDPSHLAILAPVELMISGGTTYGPLLNGSVDLAACRYWVTNGSVWTATKNGALGNVPDPAVPTTSEGVRIARASKIIDGKRHRFNLGYINSAVVADSALIDVDLIGETQSYRAMFGFGPASPSFYTATAGDLSGTILPWAA